jgi:hypothetical protein
MSSPSTETTKRKALGPSNAMPFRLTAIGTICSAAPGPGPVGRRGARGRLVHPGVVGQAQIVVGRQVDDLPAVELGSGPRRALQDPFVKQQALLSELLQPLSEVVQRARHRPETLSH